MTFESGAQAALLIDNRDETRLTHRVHFQDGREALDTTTLQPVDFAKEFSYGLLSGQFDLKGFMSDDAATVNAQLAPTSGKNRNSRLLIIAPRGFIVGSEANFFESLASSFAADVNVAGVTTADGAGTTSKNGILDGVCLHTPHGAAAVTMNEAGTLTFLNAPAVQQFAIRAVGGGTDYHVFTPTDSDNSLKSGLEGLDAFAGRTATVSGMGGLTGTTLKSGTVSIVWDGGVDLPALEVLVSESQRLLVTSGDSGNYSWNGGGSFQLSINETSLQTNVRATSWDDNTIVKGSSVAASGDLTTGFTNSNVITTGGSAFSNAGNAFDNNNSTLAVAQLNDASSLGGGYSEVAFIMNFGAGFSTVQESANLTVIGAVGSSKNVDVYGSNSLPNNPSDGTLLGSRNGTWADSTQYSIALANSTAYRYIWFRFAGNFWGAGLGTTAGIKEIEITSITTAGSADFTAYFPFTAGNLTQAAVTGTGAVASTLTNGNAVSSAIATQIASDGLTSDARYNLITGDGESAWVDGDAPTSGGYSAILSTLYLLGEGAELTVTIEHTVDDGDDAPDEGAATTLLTFTAQSAKAAELLREASAPVKRWTRVTWSLDGTTPKAVFAVALARH